MKYFDGRELTEVSEIDKLNDLSQQDCNTLAIGPQELFLEKLSFINKQLAYEGIETISVTPKWNWKAGAYDRIKEYMYRRLDMHKKSKNIDALMQRTRDKINYLRYINNQAHEMENERANLKRLGVTKDIDMTEFVETCKSFYNKLTNQCELAYKATSRKISMVPFITITDRRATFYLDIQISGLTMNICQGAKILQEIPLIPMHIIIHADLRRFLNNMRPDFSLKGKYAFNTDDLTQSKLLFPFIAKPYGDTDAYQTVCLDKYYDDIRKAFLNTDYVTLGISLMTWAQYYNIKCANPYNQTYHLHYGMPEGYSKEYLASMDKSTIARECSKKLSIINREERFTSFQGDEFSKNVCDTIECQLRDTCSYNSLITSRLKKLDSEAGCYLEGLVGFLIEYIQNKHFAYKETDQESYFSNIVTDWAYISGGEIDLWKIEYRHFDYDNDGNIIEDSMKYRENNIILDITDRLLSYYISSIDHNINSFRLCEYTYKFLEKENIIDSPKPEKVIPVDEDITDRETMKLIMQTWAESSGRR